METLQFRTNITSSEAIAVVSPELNDIEQIDGWHIEPDADSCLLTIQTTDTRISLLVEHVIQNVGYEAELINR
jgi:copper chaperone